MTILNKIGVFFFRLVFCVIVIAKGKKQFFVVIILLFYNSKGDTAHTKISQEQQQRIAQHIGSISSDEQNDTWNERKTTTIITISSLKYKSKWNKLNVNWWKILDFINCNEQKKKPNSWNQQNYQFYYAVNQIAKSQTVLRVSSEEKKRKKKQTNK